MPMTPPPPQSRPTRRCHPHQPPDLKISSRTPTCPALQPAWRVRILWEGRWWWPAARACPGSGRSGPRSVAPRVQGPLPMHRAWVWWCWRPPECRHRRTSRCWWRRPSCPAPLGLGGSPALPTIHGSRPPVDRQAVGQRCPTLGAALQHLAVRVWGLTCATPTRHRPPGWRPCARTRLTLPIIRQKTTPCPVLRPMRGAELNPCN